MFLSIQCKSVGSSVVVILLLLYEIFFYVPYITYGCTEIATPCLNFFFSDGLQFKKACENYLHCDWLLYILVRPFNLVYVGVSQPTDRN